MRRFTLIPTALAVLTLAACIQEAGPNPHAISHSDEYDDGEDYDSFGCASAPSGSGAWEDESEDGLHCNYQNNNSGEWAYSLNSSESSCVEQSWAPDQEDGYMKMWSWDGNKGCDWIIPW